MPSEDVYVPDTGYNSMRTRDVPRTTPSDADRKQAIRDLTANWKRRYTPDAVMPTLCLAALEYTQYVLSQIDRATTDAHRRAISSRMDRLLQAISTASLASTKPRKEIGDNLDALSRFCEETDVCASIEHLDAAQFMDEKEFKRLKKAFQTDDQSFY
jgi:hypothetical protein